MLGFVFIEGLELRHFKCLFYIPEPRERGPTHLPPDKGEPRFEVPILQNLRGTSILFACIFFGQQQRKGTDG